MKAKKRKKEINALFKLQRQTALIPLNFKNLTPWIK